MKRLVFILLAAFLLRTVSLSNFPAGFNADEASNGYDAYSIGHTGRDQWGNPVPLVLKSFGDYKSPLYTYLTIPSVGFFGLTKFAVRLPNAISGTLAVLIIYLLIRELVGKYKKDLGILDAETPALVGAALLAVNPWHIMMSRTGLEANLVTLFIPLGVYFFLLGLRKRHFYIWSALFFGLSFFTYHSAKLLTPLFIFGLVFTFWRDMHKIEPKKLLIPAGIIILFLSGLTYTFVLGGGGRVFERSITQGALLQGAEEKIKSINSGANPIIARLLHNKYQVVVRRFIGNYSQYFSPGFLFKDGAAESSYSMRQGVGVIYVFEGILLLGLIPLFFRKGVRKILLPSVFWLLIAPIPAALATGAGYAGNRAEGMLPVLQILAAFGFLGWVSLFKKSGKKFFWGVLAVFCTFSIFSVYRFLSFYFAVPPDEEARQMLFGSLEASTWLSKNSDGKDVIVSRSLSEPQIFVAFANKWNPSDFQNETKGWGLAESGATWVDQIPSYSVGKYTFKSLDFRTDSKLKNILIVGRPEEFPKQTVPLEVIKYADGNPAIFIVEPN